jgi:hypothetical protein
MKSKPNPPHPKLAAIHGVLPASPYDLYKGTKIWEIVEKAIEDLIANNDIAETTQRDYIVGYICKQLQRL